MLRNFLCYSYSYIAFIVGVDATVVVKSLILLKSYGAIIGVSYLNHFLDVTKISDDESVNLIKQFIEGKHGEKASEVKVSVITLQVLPKLFSPYFKLIRRAHTINESNAFEGCVVKAYTLAAQEVVNTVLLNHSNDVLQCETSCNINTIKKYSEGNRNHISFTDTNHNVKNCLPQVGKGSF